MLLAWGPTKGYRRIEDLDAALEVEILPVCEVEGNLNFDFTVARHVRMSGRRRPLMIRVNRKVKVQRTRGVLPGPQSQKSLRQRVLDKLSPQD